MKTFGDKYVWGVLKPTINGSLSPLILAPSCSHMYAPIISYYFNLVHARPPLRYLCCAPRPNILFNSPSQPYNFTWNNCRNLEVVEKNYLQFTLVLFCFFPYRLATLEKTPAKIVYHTNFHFVPPTKFYINNSLLILYKETSVNYFLSICASVRFIMILFITLCTLLF